MTGNTPTEKLKLFGDERRIYDQRKVQCVAGFMAALGYRTYEYDTKIEIHAGIVCFSMKDFRDGQNRFQAEKSVRIWEIPNDHHAYERGYKAAMHCICAIEQAKGNCVS